MNRNITNPLSIALLLSVLFTDIAEGDVFSFSAVPSSCVALHRGQKCFTDISLYWISPNGAKLCVFRNEEPEALMCSSETNAKYQLSYATATSENYSLIDELGNTLSTVTVSTAWVYRTGKRSSSGWRLF